MNYTKMLDIRWFTTETDVGEENQTIMNYTVIRRR